MPDSIAWSFNATGSTGGTSKAAGKTAADAVLIVRKTVPDAFDDSLNLQIDSADKIAFMALTSSVYDADLTVKGGVTAVKLTGPLVLHGNAVALFSTDLGELEVKNSTGGDVELSILLGFDIAA
ncbi:MAG: hypothetical protein QOJ27_2648 [Sphingomonadales bacterium]|nr:hypothetical protein [Sphingomonadales bacterium]